MKSTQDMNFRGIGTKATTLKQANKKTDVSKSRASKYQLADSFQQQSAEQAQIKPYQEETFTNLSKEKDLQQIQPKETKGSGFLQSLKSVNLKSIFKMPKKIMNSQNPRLEFEQSDLRPLSALINEDESTDGFNQQRKGNLGNSSSKGNSQVKQKQEFSCERRDDYFQKKEAINNKVISKSKQPANNYLSDEYSVIGSAQQNYQINGAIKTNDKNTSSDIQTKSKQNGATKSSFSMSSFNNVSDVSSVHQQEMASSLTINTSVLNYQSSQSSLAHFQNQSHSQSKSKDAKRNLKLRPSIGFTKEQQNKHSALNQGSQNLKLKSNSGSSSYFTSTNSKFASGVSGTGSSTQLGFGLKLGSGLEVSSIDFNPSPNYNQWNKTDKSKNAGHNEKKAQNDLDFHKRKSQRIREESNEGSIVSQRKNPKAKNSIDLESTMKSLVVKDKSKAVKRKENSKIEKQQSHQSPNSNKHSTSSLSEKSSTSSNTGESPSSSSRSSSNSSSDNNQSKTSSDSGKRTAQDLNRRRKLSSKQRSSVRHNEQDSTKKLVLMPMNSKRSLKTILKNKKPDDYLKADLKDANYASNAESNVRFGVEQDEESPGQQDNEGRQLLLNCWKKKLRTAQRLVDILKQTTMVSQKRKESSRRESSFSHRNRRNQQEDEPMNETGDHKTSLNSSFQGESTGIPIRVHGKMKYMNEIIKVKRRLKWFIIFRSLLALLSCCLLQFETEILISQNNIYNSKTLLMQWLATLTTVFEILVIILFFRDKVLLIKLRKDRLRQSSNFVFLLEYPFILALVNIFRTKHKYAFMWDMLIHLVINPPGMNYKFIVKQLGFEVVYTWDMICACLSLLRLHIFFQLIPLFSVYTQTQSKRICNQTGAKAKVQFSWKALMKTRPYLFLAFAICFSVISFGIVLRNLERANIERNGKFDFIWDAFWVIIIIMLTIGYGDITIDTNIGRLIGIFAAFCGFLVYSLFIVSMNNLIVFDDNDANFYKEFKRREGVRKIQRRADKTIGNFLLFVYHTKKKNELINYTKTMVFQTQGHEIKENTKNQITTTNSTRYLFSLIFQVKLFHHKRMVCQQRDEDIEKLLSSMEFYLYMSQNEQAFILSKFEDLDGLIEEITQMRVALKTSTTKCKALSFQLNNFTRILSEFGPSTMMDNYESINPSSLMSLEEMNSFVVTRIEQHKNMEAYARNGTIAGPAFALRGKEINENMDSLRTSDNSTDSLDSAKQRQQNFSKKFSNHYRGKEQRGSQVHNLYPNDAQLIQNELLQQKARMSGASATVFKNQNSLLNVNNQEGGPFNWRLSGSKGISGSVLALNGVNQNSQMNNSSISEVSEETSSNNSFETETQRGIESKVNSHIKQKEGSSSSDQEESSDESGSNERDEHSESESEEVTGGHSSQTRFDMKSGLKLEHHHRSSYEETSDMEGSQNQDQNQDRSGQSQISRKSNGLKNQDSPISPSYSDREFDSQYAASSKSESKMESLSSLENSKAGNQNNPVTQKQQKIMSTVKVAYIPPIIEKMTYKNHEERVDSLKFGESIDSLSPLAKLDKTKRNQILSVQDSSRADSLANKSAKGTNRYGLSEPHSFDN